MVPDDLEGCATTPDERRLTAHQQQTLKDLHRKIKGTYLQLTALLDELDILQRTMLRH